MKFSIIESLETSDAWREVQFKSEVYVRDLEVQVGVWGLGCHQSMTITQLGNALKIGATCERFRFDLPMSSEKSIWGLLDDVDYSLAQLLDVLASVDFDHGRPEIFGASVSAGSEPAIRVFSPFRLDRLKPLDRLPNKWTVKHAIRAVANGQYDSLRCKGQYTDDYAYDAARNFGEGEINAALPFIQKIIECPSGWRVYDDGNGRIGLCCHHFDNNEIKVNLEASRAA